VTTSLSKGLSLLGTLAESSSPLSVRDLATLSKLPKSSVHRLMVELREQGFVETTSDGYQLGLRLFELGGTALRHNRIVAEARPYMEDLYERTRYLIQLGVLQGTDVLYLARVGRQGHQRVASHVGGRIPATCTAIGKALLAFDDVTLEAAIAEGLVRRTRHSLTSPDQLRLALADVRRTGLAFEIEEARIGLACVASPLLVNGVARAALSLTVPVAQYEPRAMGAALKATSSRLSAMLSDETTLDI